MSLAGLPNGFAFAHRLAIPRLLIPMARDCRFESYPRNQIGRRSLEVNPSGLCFCLAVDRNPDVTEKLNQ